MARVGDRADCSVSVQKCESRIVDDVPNSMFTMAKIKDGRTYLNQHLTANDYYCEKETVIGQWVGRGAERLGLRGEIRSGDAAFEALRKNRHPAGSKKLTPRDSEVGLDHGGHAGGHPAPRGP